MITRSAEEAGPFMKSVSELGGRPRPVPLVKAVPPENPQDVKSIINKIIRQEVNYVIFMSKSSVEETFRLSDNPEELAETLSKLKTVAVGPVTKSKLEEHGVRVEMVPRSYSSFGLANLFKELDLREKVVAILRTSGASPYLRVELEKLGAEVLEVPTYKLEIAKREASELLDDLLEKRVAAIAFTSSRAVRSLFTIASKHGALDDLKTSLKWIIVATIGPFTKRALEEHGVEASVMPSEHTCEALTRALVDRLREED